MSSAPSPSSTEPVAGPLPVRRPTVGGAPRRHHVADNVVHFARVLRSAGLPVGPDRVLLALEALERVGFARRDDVHAALSAVMLSRHEQQPLFDAAFAAFWRDPKLLERLMYLVLPKVTGRGKPDQADRGARLSEALQPRRQPATRDDGAPPTAEDEIRFDASLTWSDRERLQQADFATMTNDEFAQARRLVATLALPLAPVRIRRQEPAVRGRPDLRRTLRESLRAPDLLLPRCTRPRLRPPPVVVLLDISGSMERYTRLFLHFAHALGQRQRVQTLVFGTRLTSITHCLRHRDPDEALARADARVSDWRGGTRIATSLDAFNRLWARRLLTGNAALLLVTDGLDRDESGQLDAAAARLARFAHQFIWLNPLLRYDGFEPRAAGIRAILPHVDRFLPMHNLASLAALARLLDGRPQVGQRHRPTIPTRPR